jgi:hypothetical protein
MKSGGSDRLISLLKLLVKLTRQAFSEMPMGKKLGA